MSIFDLLSNEKFEKIRFFLKEHNIITSDMLVLFDTSQLYFIPGISQEVVAEAEKIITEFQSYDEDKVLASSVISNKGTFVTAVSMPKSKDCFDTAHILDESADPMDQDILFEDIPIHEIYSKIPRSGPFIRHCYSIGKKMMSQLSVADFTDSVKMKGIRKLPEIFLEQYNMYYQQPHKKVMSTSAQENTPIESVSTSVQEATPIENMSTSVQENTPIENVFLDIPRGGIFVSYCKKRGLSTVQDLYMFDFKNTKVTGLGPLAMSIIRGKFVSVVRNLETKLMLKGIHSSNYSIPVVFFVDIALLSSSFISRRLPPEIKTIGDLTELSFSYEEYTELIPLADAIKHSAEEQFLTAFANEPDNTKSILISRSNGITLENLGEEYGLTRERIRQIESRGKRNLRLSVLFFATSVSSFNNGIIDSNCVKKAGLNEKERNLFFYLLKDYIEYEYLAFNNMFISKQVYPNFSQLDLENYIGDIIGSHINFYENLLDIEAGLATYKLDFIDYYDVMSLLINRGYKFYGDFVMRPGQSYAFVCHDAIYRFFEFDIKLDSRKDNTDLVRLRALIHTHYGGLKLPDSNRALSSRIASELILCGRGRYCPSEKIIYNRSLVEEVCSYADKGEHNSYSYNELFEQFRGRFLAETNIHNPDFLHGIMMYLYPDDYKYSRDYITKLGKEKINISDRLKQLLSSSAKAVSLSEIQNIILGTAAAFISQSIQGIEDVIQWDYNKYRHISSIKISIEDQRHLKYLLDQLLEENNGYTTDILLMDKARREMPSFLQENTIEVSISLFYIMEYLLKGDDYSFKRPHIAKKGSDISISSSIDVLQSFFPFKDIINYSDFLEVAKQLGWAEGTISSIFKDLEKGYLRISEDSYIAKNSFNISAQNIVEISHWLNNLLNTNDYYPFVSITQFNFDSLSTLSVPWTTFLLEAIIKEYIDEFCIVDQLIRYRKYQKGLIVKKEDRNKGFDYFVYSEILSSDKTFFSEQELLTLLTQKGLITGQIPQEIYKSNYLVYKNEMFHLKDKASHSAFLE